jgi:WhiB family transcriptional regulator, redox-sensing transcriptional regulator
MPTVAPERTAATWMADAACLAADAAIFFPDPGDPAADAKRVCGACTVMDDCLDYALDRGIVDGVWGGLTVKERASLKRKAKL